MRVRVRIRRRPLLLLLSGEHSRLGAALHGAWSGADSLFGTDDVLADDRRRAHVTRWSRSVLLLRRVD